MIRKGPLNQLKIWMFAGMCDKSDVLLYLCTLLSSANQKVLLVDGTDTHKYPLYIGQLDRPLAITEFMKFHVACGFTSQMELEIHLRKEGVDQDKYDFVIYDIENVTFCSIDTWNVATACTWNMDYGIWSFHKGTEWMNDWIQHTPALTELLFQRIYVLTVDCLLEHIFMDSSRDRWPVKLTNESIVIPWDEVDTTLKLGTEHVRELRIKPLSRRYKRVLCRLIEQLTPLDQSQIKRALLQVERGNI